MPPHRPLDQVVSGQFFRDSVITLSSLCHHSVITLPSLCHHPVITLSSPLCHHHSVIILSSPLDQVVSGQFFGESVITGRRRESTCVANSACEMLSLSYEDLSDLFTK